MVICVIFQVDIQLETGEYFMSDKKKSAKKWQERQEKQAEKTAANKRKRDESFIPPKVLCCFSLFFYKFMSCIYCFIISFIVFNQTSICTLQEPTKPVDNSEDANNNVAEMAMSIKV
jgi:ribosomal RNA assembly protein